MQQNEETQVEEEVVEENDSKEEKLEEETTEEENPEFTDTKEETTETKTEEKQEHKGGKSSFFAQMRREREAREKEANNQQKVKVENTKQEDLYLKGVIAGTGGKNPYTGQEIKDELDLKEFQLMQELASQGKDPVKDYLEALKTKEREATLEKQKAEEEEKANKERFTNEFNDFVNEFGKEKLDEISKDKDFLEFADNFIGDVTVTNIYKMYNQINDKINKKSEELAIQKAARMKSSSGKVGKSTDFTEKPDFNAMSIEEFKEYDRLKEERRRASMRK